MIEPVPTDDTPNPAPAAAGEGAPIVAPEPAPAATVAARPDWLPESFWDAEANAPKAEDLTARLSRADELEAAEAARREGVPAGADEYKLDLPENVVGLDGQPVRLIPDDPGTKEAQALAAELGLSQASFTKLVAFHAGQLLGAQKAQAEQFQAEMAAELTKLGTNAKARVDAVSSGLGQHLGDKAQALLDAMGTADAVEALETLLAKVSAPAISASPQAEAGPQSLAQRLYGS
jgi:hypothetical protein